MLKNTTGFLAFISGAVWHEVSLTNARRNGHKLQQRIFQLGIEKVFSWECTAWDLQVILKGPFRNWVGEHVRNDMDRWQKRNRILTCLMLSLPALPFHELTVGYDLAVLKLM